ncbi:patatin-like phospholipase family protein [Salinisphaera sp. T31B1]|uniref:patatin-like phospholipase family protein n=1 Tax=Salinisphaera sp. T31B1 TaxID=727963 RepID=UPI003340D871
MEDRQLANPTGTGRRALALTAGGARGAYQAGVLQRVGEISALRDRPVPFEIITGASAGAINGAAVAAYSESLGAGTRRLADLWSGLTVQQVYRTGPGAVWANARRLAADFTIGRLTGSTHTQALLDATPLRALLERELPMAGVARAIAAGRLHALAITAAGYHSGKSYTFIQGVRGHALWRKSRRIALAATLEAAHVCASSAIPLVFAPVALSTGSTVAWFGDGAMRLTNPLSPAIRLGADRLLAIGIRCHRTADDLTDRELATAAPDLDSLGLPRRPPLAQICGVFLNALFLDHLDADIDHLLRMNALVEAYTEPGAARLAELREPMRVIEPLVMSPSQDFAEIAHGLLHRLPRTVRWMLDALGRPDPRSADLTSYLLFDPEYTRALIDIGYRDASERIDEIETFLRS